MLAAPAAHMEHACGEHCARPGEVPLALAARASEVPLGREQARDALAPVLKRPGLAWGRTSRAALLGRLGDTLSRVTPPAPGGLRPGRFRTGARRSSCAIALRPSLALAGSRSRLTSYVRRPPGRSGCSGPGSRAASSGSGSGGSSSSGRTSWTSRLLRCGSSSRSMAATTPSVGGRMRGGIARSPASGGGSCGCRRSWSSGRSRSRWRACRGGAAVGRSTSGVEITTCDLTRFAAPPRRGAARDRRHRSRSARSSRRRSRTSRTAPPTATSSEASRISVSVWRRSTRSMRSTRSVRNSSSLSLVVSRRSFVRWVSSRIPLRISIVRSVGSMAVSGSMAPSKSKGEARRRARLSRVVSERPRCPGTESACPTRALGALEERFPGLGRRLACQVGTIVA